MSTTSWGYDARGNRTSSAGVAATYDVQDKLLTRGAASYGWDALGGRASKTEAGLTTQYVHDGMGALLSVVLPDSSAVAYEYDGLQRRVARRRNTAVVTRLVYDSQSRVVAEVDASGAVTSRFVYAAESSSPDALVQPGATLAYVKNHLGSIRLVIDSASGAVVQRLDYDAWGVVTQDTAPRAQPFGFAGGIMDADTGFTHFGFRDYDAASAVWTAMDPIRLRLGGYSPEPLLQIRARSSSKNRPRLGSASLPTRTLATIRLCCAPGGGYGGLACSCWRFPKRETEYIPSDVRRRNGWPANPWLSYSPSR